MDSVNIYTVTTAKSPSVQECVGCYVIERIHDGIPYTHEGFLYREAITKVDLTIQLLCNAIYILKKLDIEFDILAIATEEPIVDSAFNKKWIDKWIADDWTNARGKEIKYQDDWKKLVEMLTGLSKKYIFSNQNTSYFNLMHIWSEKKLKEKREEKQVHENINELKEKLNETGKRNM